MIEAIGNIIVMVAFGLLLGTVVSMLMIFFPPRKDTKREEGESYLKYINRRSKESAERFLPSVQRKRLIMLAGAYYIVTIIIILTVIFTPLEMKWLVFLISLFGAFLITRYIYIKTKFGKMGVKDLFFDFFDRELPGREDR